MKLLLTVPESVYCQVGSHIQRDCLGVLVHNNKHSKRIKASKKQVLQQSRNVNKIEESEQFVCKTGKSLQYEVEKMCNVQYQFIKYTLRAVYGFSGVKTDCETSCMTPLVSPAA